MEMLTRSYLANDRRKCILTLIESSIFRKTKIKEVDLLSQKKLLKSKYVLVRNLRPFLILVQRNIKNEDSKILNAKACTIHSQVVFIISTYFIRSKIVIFLLQS